ncbi:MAG: hypothetical protein WCP29_19160 [Acidobacteriota bacterium]
MMSQRRVILLMLALCASVSSMAIAQGTTAGPPPQGPPGAGPGRSSGAASQAFSFKWWQDARFKTELTLAVDQCRRAEDVYQAILPRMTADKEELDRLERRLSEVIATGVLPEADVVKLIDQAETARAQLGKARTLMIYRLRQILTPDQRLKMKALHDEWEKQRRQGPVRKRPAGLPREGGLL